MFIYSFSQDLSRGLIPFVAHKLGSAQILVLPSLCYNGHNHRLCKEDSLNLYNIFTHLRHFREKHVRCCNVLFHTL